MLCRRRFILYFFNVLNLDGSNISLLTAPKKAGYRKPKTETTSKTNSKAAESKQK